MSKELTTPIIIGGVTYYVKYGTLSMIEFGKLTGLPVKQINDIGNLQLDNLYKLYYSGLVAGCKLAGIPCPEYDAFLIEVEKDEKIMDTLRELKNPEGTEGN